MPGVPGLQSYSSVASSNVTWFPEGMPPSGVNDGMRQVQADIRKWYTDAEWVNLGDTPSRASATTFKIVGDVTTEYPVHTRLKCYDASTIYSTVTGASYSAPDTTITVVNDSGSLTASLTSVARSIIRPTNIAIPSTIGRKGANIASATTTDIWAATADFVDITGTTTITGLGTATNAGIQRTVRFTGALILTHNGTSLILPGAANITTAANDTAIFRSLDASGNAICILYNKASVTGTGATVLATTPTLVTPVLGVATGTSVNLGGNASPTTNNVAGSFMDNTGQGQFSRDSGISGRFNRKTNDGDIVAILQDGTQEGSISVSGTTISYNAFLGSHWSQLSDGSKPTIIRGTVMETVNALCAWEGEAAQDRLPKSKISDTDSSSSVYGVFLAWDEDWETSNDMYVAALGAGFIRLQSGEVPVRGALLVSAGNGCARIQSDDVIRASTIGKISAAVVTQTYHDGSFLVPCILMCG